MKQKHTSESAAQKTIAELNKLRLGKASGLLCRECHKRIPWRKLTTEYRMDGNVFIRIWFCSCGMQLREDELK